MVSRVEKVSSEEQKKKKKKMMMMKDDYYERSISISIYVCMCVRGERRWRAIETYIYAVVSPKSLIL